MKQLYLVFLLTISLHGPAQGIGQQEIDQGNAAVESKLNADPAQALTGAMKWIEQAQQSNYYPGLDRATALAGVAYYKIDRYDSAKTYIDSAIALCEQHSDSINLAYATYWKGNLQLFKGAYAKALDLYQRTYDLATRTGDQWNLTRALDGKASIYESLSENGKAEEVYREALKTATAAHFTDWIPTVTFSLGNIAYKNGDIDNAIRQYNEAIALSDKTNNLNNKANCLQQLASIYYEKNDSQKAMEYIREAMDIFKQTGSTSSYSYGSLMMSAILLKDKEWDLAIQLAQKSLQEGKQKKETALQKDAAEILYYAYLGKGNTAKALDYHVTFHQLSETKHREELTKKLTQIELQSNFETEREMESARQEKLKAEMSSKIAQEKLMKKAISVGFIFIALIAGIAIFAFLQKRKDTRLIDAEKRKSDELLGSLLPHELMNTVKEQRQQLHQNQSTVLFADIKSAGGPPEAIRAEREQLLRLLEPIFLKHQLEPVHTDEDVMMGIGRNGTSARLIAENVIRAGIEMLEVVKARKEDRQQRGQVGLDLGIGIHTGTVIAGIVGLKMSDNDIWGDTVTIAARIEQHGMTGKVNLSASTHTLVNGAFNCRHYGSIPLDNHTELGMYFIDLSVA